ncbi:acyl-CoA N-acyltransferase [Corynespora cassiicola Philippines]|uniref:Acyl-CoA N-acyltransferase n=1 Tax=Corynespora cassiicola Philippines TaxID=1448308 RepID=A0A2T2N1M5_CORCC|nr:acyl-CoA N-acyltransferase [Corynespora cassiicola Philippines]
MCGGGLLYALRAEEPREYQSSHSCPAQSYQSSFIFQLPPNPNFPVENLEPQEYSIPSSFCKTMAPTGNELGSVVPDEPATPPSYDIKLNGRYVTLVPIDSNHAEDLYKLVGGPDKASLFDYLFDEPPESMDSFRSTLSQKAATTNPWSYTILLNSTTGEKPKAVGMASLMRMDLPNRVIEVGSILFSPALQRTPAATEAMYLLAHYVFETLKFRRYEWKCNSLNGPSRRAATRLGFVYEGTFRQHMIARGRNRDTSWYAMLDGEWPGVKRAMERWLSEENFDEQGKQRRRLEELRTV